MYTTSLLNPISSSFSILDVTSSGIVIQRNKPGSVYNRRCGYFGGKMYLEADVFTNRVTTLLIKLWSSKQLVIKVQQPI